MPRPTGPRSTRCGRRCTRTWTGSTGSTGTLAWAAKRKALQAGARRAAVGRPGDRLPRLPHPGGQGLDDYATWCALTEVHGPDWHEWPAELRHPASPAVAAFRDANADAVDFHRWLQWVLDEQFVDDPGRGHPGRHGAGRHARPGRRRAPGGLGLVGLQDVFAQGMTVGAPPDAFNQNGQDWAQPPWRPDRLAELGLRAVPGHGLHRAAVGRRRPGRPHHRAVPAVVDPEGHGPDRGHLPPVRPRGADRHPGAGGQAGQARWWSARISARWSRGCATTCGSGASSAPRSCGSSSSSTAAAHRCGRSGGGSTAWPRSPPMTCRRPPAIWPAITSGCGTRWAC